MSSIFNSIRRLKQNLDRFFFGFMKIVLPLQKGSGKKRVLLVLTGGIGDFVFLSQYFHHLREIYPESDFALVCRTETAPLARLHSMFSRVIAYRHLSCRRNYLYRWSILGRIREMQPAFALYLSYHREHIGDELTLCSGAQYTAAFSGNNEMISEVMREEHHRLYTHVVETPDHIPEIEKYRSFFDCLGARTLTVREPEFLIEVKKRFSVEDIKKIHGSISGGYICIIPGGSGQIRYWPSDTYVELLNGLRNRYELPIVICGSKNEESHLRELARNTNFSPSVVCNLPIDMTAFLIANARLVIGNESGLLHLAAVSCVPAVGILGGGHFNRYFPYGETTILTNPLPCFECNWNCQFEKPLCLTEITVEKVIAATENLLGAGSTESKG
jgi:ADP-heptose:LPS heptosyltransferase